MLGLGVTLIITVFVVVCRKAPEGSEQTTRGGTVLQAWYAPPPTANCMESTADESNVICSPPTDVAVDVTSY